MTTQLTSFSRRKFWTHCWEKTDQIKYKFVSHALLINRQQTHRRIGLVTSCCLCVARHACIGNWSMNQQWSIHAWKPVGILIEVHVVSVSSCQPYGRMSSHFVQEPFKKMTWIKMNLKRRYCGYVCWNLAICLVLSWVPHGPHGGCDKESNATSLLTLYTDLQCYSRCSG